MKSQGFKDSTRHRELLQYLAERSSHPENLKESEIARHLFGKDSKFDPAADPIVRSYVSLLRKKLEHYYLTTPDDFTYKIEIPKGHYMIQYTPVSIAEDSKTKTPGVPVYYSAAIAVLSILLIVSYYREFNHNDTASRPAGPAPNMLWNEFLKPDARPTLVVLGDFFFMRERAKNDGYYRLININTIDEYLEYIRQNPEFGNRYIKNHFTYLRPSTPWGLMQIFPILQKAPNGVSLKLASQFTSDDFKTNNIIFIGSFKTMYLLKNFLNFVKLDYSFSPHSFRIKDGISDSTYVFIPEKLLAGSLENDYGVVAAGKGPDGSTMMMMLGFSESGVIQATHAASDPALFQTIAENYPAGARLDPSSFTLVIGAKGMTQSLYSADIKYAAGLGSPKKQEIKKKDGKKE